MREIRIPGIRRVLRISLADKTLRGEIDDEIRFHLEARVDELVELGTSPEEARRRAETEYGDVGASARELVDVDHRRMGHQRREEFMESFLEDLRYAARGLLRQRSLLIVTTLALSVGIAANAIMFGVVDQLLIRPPADVQAHESLRRIYLRHVPPSGPHYTVTVMSYPALIAIASGIPSAEVAMFTSARSFTLGSGRDARRVDVQLATGSYFRVLGVSIPSGRGFAPGEDSITHPANVAVISDGFWKRELGEAEVLGKVLKINDVPFTVIGIAPRGFSGIDRQNVDLWVPLSAMAAKAIQPEWQTAESSWWIQGIARTSSGIASDATEGQATQSYRNAVRSWPVHRQYDTTASVLFGSIVGMRTPDGFASEGKVSLWLMGVSAIVLLIACANVANLLIARMFQRRKEIAVRLALGVSRSRLLRMLFTESALLALLAATLAVGIALLASRMVQNILLPGIVWSDSVLDPRVLAFTLAVTVLCILLAGIAPAMEGVGTRATESLKASARVAGGGANRLRYSLLVLQAALSIVLLIGAGLFIRSLRNVTSKDVGVDFDRAILVTMNLGAVGFSPTQIQDVFRNSYDRITALPRVVSASVVRQSIPGRGGRGLSIRAPGLERHDFNGGGPYYSVVDVDFFSTLGTRIVRGRNFTADEERLPSRSVIITKVIADAYWPGADPIGRCALVGQDTVCSTVVGVVDNVLFYRLVKDDRAMLYLPPTHPAAGAEPPRALIVRAAGDPASLVSLVRNEIQALHPNMPFISVTPYAETVAPQLRPWRLGATMFTLFGFIALAIAAVGLYSVLAYWVSQRTQEIGVRMALGAQRHDVIKLVTWQMSRAIGVGLLLGTVAAVGGSRWIVDMLYETSPRDPLVYATAAAALAVAAIVASIVPALRSTAVDPAKAIRVE